MGEDAGRKSQRQFAELVQKTIVESHSFPPGHGFPGYKPFTSVLKELRYREMGDKRMRLDKIWPSLMKSENREFQQSHEFKVRGEAMLDSRRAVSSAGVIDLEEEVMRGFVHDRAQFDGHSVKFILAIDTEALARNNANIGTNAHMKRIMEKYVILMTNLGQIRMYVEEDNNYVLTHRFNLPAHLYNFKELSWNVERDELCALGVSPRMHIDEIEDSQFSHTSRRSNSNPFTRSHALAVISVHPIVVVKYLVRLDPEMFGPVNNIHLRGDALLYMCQKNIMVYNMRSLCDEYIQSVPSPVDYGSPSSDRVVLFNMIITKKPQPIKIFSGSFYSIDFGDSCMHSILLFNNNMTHCRLEGCDGSQPIFIDRWNDNIPSSMCLTRGDESTRFHPDSSSKILRIEGNFLKCFIVQSVSSGEGMNGDGDKRSRVNLLWSVRLLPLSNRVRPPSPDISMDRGSDNVYHTNVINSIKLVPGNMLMIVITYNADMAQIEFNPAPYVYIPIAIFIDATTGILVKVTPINNSIFYTSDTVQMGLGGFFSMARCDGDAKIVRIDRLVEKEPPKELPNYKSGVLNRRQRRLNRRRKGSDTTSDDTSTSREMRSLFPGSHEIV